MLDRWPLGFRLRRSAKDQVQDESRKADFGDQQIRAAAQGEDGQALLAGELNCLDELGLCPDLDEETCRTAKAQGGVPSKRDLLLDLQRGHGLRVP